MVAYLNMLVELHQTFDELEQLGVFKHPEDVGILVKYFNPSLHLVTSFTDVCRYSKPFPNRPAWLAIQFYCPDLCRTHAHLVQGTRQLLQLHSVRHFIPSLNCPHVPHPKLLVCLSLSLNEPANSQSL